MASRAFSTGVRRLKMLNWRLNGTTEDVTWMTESLNDTVDHVPGLEAIESAQIK